MAAAANPADADAAMIGRQIGAYKIERRIGAGGMGVVYQARHDKIVGKSVAIKVLHKEMSADAKLVKRFINEANAISRAQHSSIVQVHDFGQLDDGTAYIMMEMLEGEPLLSRLEAAQGQGKGLGLQQVVEFGRQIATALAVTHAKNIVHRDLKPENIFIVPDDATLLGERVKLLDFGIAKVLEGETRKTTVGIILGTPLYMSPEQCEGREDLDCQVDVYALGVMLFEMLAGKLPFHADTAAALMRQHMFKEPPRLRDVAKGLPPELDELVASMLAKEPGKRPTMEQVAAQLEALQPQVNGRVSSVVSGILAPRIARRAQVTEGESTDPFAATLGGAESVPNALAATLNANLDSEAASSAVSRRSQPGVSRSSGPGVAAGEPQPGMSSTAKVPAGGAWARRIALAAGVLILAAGGGVYVLRTQRAAAPVVTAPIAPPAALAPPIAPPTPAAVPAPGPVPPPVAAGATPPTAAPPSEDDKAKPAEEGKKGKKKSKGKGGKGVKGNEGDAKGDKRGDDAEKPWY
jgi:serine/threonine-protein kinase